ncbi:Gp49 family protein [Psychrobacter vallis]|uniref:Gp49 family protein n=1 Tax=Psychrobacter vallis TaxID=248451 RepID=UPI001919E6B3|nr:Gp49 family protein [Psychrobacter vallis]
MSDLPNKVTLEALIALADSGHTEYNHLAGTLTHCTITLPCGFSVTGESACVDPANYNEELGREIARKKAVNALWPLEGYLLANDRYRAELASKAKEGNSYEDNATCSECKRSYLS